MEYNIGDILIGTISGVKSYGIFIKSDNIDTFCHISNLSHKFINNIFDEYHIGQEIRSKIIKMTDDKIEVSIKALIDKPEPLSDKSESFQKLNKLKYNINTKEHKNNSFEDLLNDYLKSSKERLDNISARTKRKNKR